MDVTVVNPLQRLLVVQAAARPGHDLTTRFNEKITKHGEACRRASLAFVPLVVETLGGWEELAEKQIKRLGAALERHTGQEEAEISCPACQG
jgi:sirohydrochlorin ferrochelatase